MTTQKHIQTLQQFDPNHTAFKGLEIYNKNIKRNKSL